MERFESAVPVRDDHEPRRPTILFLGRHEQRKGLNVLLDAFATLERPAVLWVASEGPATEVQRRRHPESDRVHWLGMLSDDEVAARLAGADVLCAPSLHGESFGMVLLEGMAAGCAVVASDIEGYRKAAGGHATLVPPGDTTALSRALGVALADAVEGSGPSSPEARKAAIEHARNWSMESLAERYVDVYERAIASYRARRS
jgi:phosphatidylinositol alpha-mannosyltransferase